MRNTSSVKLSNIFAKALEKTLKVEANSTSCVIIYEPKAPKKLDKFKK